MDLFFFAGLFGWAKFPADRSLDVTFAILGVGVFSPLRRTRGQAPPAAPSLAQAGT